MSDPNLIMVDGDPFIWGVSEQLNPTADEPVIDNYNISRDYNWLFLWWNRNTNDTFFCTNNRPGEMVWKRILLSDVIYDENGNGVSQPLAVANGGTGSTIAADARISLGLELNSSRSYQAVPTPQFSTVYTPNATHDTFVLGSFQLDSVLLGSTTITAQVNTGSGFTTIATVGLAGVVATNYQTLSFIVPAGAQYQLVADSSGASPVILSLQTLTL